MATVVLFHSALGRTRHVIDWAEALMEDGHTFVVPDLFGGLTFGDVDAAVDHVDSESMDHWVEAARAATSAIKGPRIYMGFSFGADVAEGLALTDSDAVGLALLHGALAPSVFDVAAWRAGLRAQAHYARRDPWIDPDEIAAFFALADEACETYVYEGDAHLFGFEGWHEYDDEASHLMFERLGDFLATFD